MTYSAPSVPAAGLRLHFNENTGGCSPAVLAALRSIAPTDTAFYPDYAPVTSAAERYFGVPAGWVQLTNGLDEGLHVAAQAAARGRANAAAIIVEPAFEMYAACADAAGLREIHIAPDADFAFPLQQILDAATPDVRLINLTDPNNPTGLAIPAGSIEASGGRATRRAGARRRSLRGVQRPDDDRSAAGAVSQCDRGPDVCEGAWPGGVASGRAHRASGRAGAAAAPVAAVQPEHLRRARARGGVGRSRAPRRVRRAGGRVEAADLRVLRRARNPLLAERGQLRAAAAGAGRRTPSPRPWRRAASTFATSRLRPAATGCVRITAGVVEHTRACLAALEDILASRSR